MKCIIVIMDDCPNGCRAKDSTCREKPPTPPPPLPLQKDVWAVEVAYVGVIIWVLQRDNCLLLLMLIWWLLFLLVSHTIILIPEQMTKRLNLDISVILRVFLLRAVDSLARPRRPHRIKTNINH